ncbi:MAG: hypothetical protein RLY30_887 [Pseudomonadota bacterium]|jgi:PAS domain S-box-containing protein
MLNDRDIIDARGKLLALDRSQAVIQFDLLGHVVEANQNFLSLFEYTLEDLRGRHHSLFCEPEYVSSPEYSELWTKLARGERDAGQYRRRSRSGRTIWIQSSYNPILDLQGRPLKVIKFATDISEQKLAEQALSEAKQRADDALKSKQLFLSTMSHELRTPMNVIIGLGQLLIDDDTLQADHKEQVDDIVKAGGHLLSLINDVLDLSQVESGLTTLRPTQVRPDQVIDDAAKLLEVLARGRGVRLEKDEPCGETVLADPFRLKQVLVNLISNAVKYNRAQGQVRIERAVKEDRLRISIQDTGRGIPASRMHELFQPFNRLGAEQTEIEGTGIGLSICKRMVEAMGGTIGASSEEEVGSCFWIELPVQARAGPSVPQPIDANTINFRVRSDTARRWRILVAEDHVVNQRLIRRQLEMLGYECWVTANGEEAEAALSQKPFDLLLTDVNMPVMDGYTLARRVRASKSDAAQLPIVFLTADVIHAHTDEWRASGANAYLTKPTQLDALSQCLKGLLDCGLEKEQRDECATQEKEHGGH